jgi:3-hydroxymyristoyl/3-hydroxydecanoyl-(acyl carrier protein) dehydratase
MDKPLTQRFKVDCDDPCFEGHFPGFPVYPAVLQLSLLAETVSRMHGSAYTITAIPAAKFLCPVGPDSILSVELTPIGENCANFMIRCNGETVTKGKVSYRTSVI